MKLNIRLGGIFLAGGLILALASCGGGGGGGGGSASSATPTAAVSSGAITAIGSVFVNGHEFNTSGASVVDDDTGATMKTTDLEVGMVVAVNSAAGSTTAAPQAADIHVSPLARGFVDASDGTAGTITVMGQTVQLTASTAFSDHRACVTATTSPCPAVAGQGDLATSGAPSGSFVAVHGYLFSTGASAQIVATLVSVQDYTAGTSRFKLEGQVTGVSGSVLTIGAESVDLSKAACVAKGATVLCGGAYAKGDIVAASGVTAPAAGTFTAAVARLSRLLPQTAGTTVEVEGKVSSVSGTTFVIRGITIDGSGLTVPLPAFGDRVELLGTIAADGTSVRATSIEHDVPAATARYILAGPLSTVAAGTTSGTFNVTVLGQTILVDASTHIADRTVFPPPTFNITNFQAYLNGLKSPYVVLRTYADGSGALHATDFDVVTAPANGFVGIVGAADAAVGTSGTSVSVHGVSVGYNPANTLPTPNENIVKGSFLLAAGALTTSGSVDTTKTVGFLFVLPPNAGGDKGFHGFRHF
jgi:hypothetical protein